MPIRLPSPTPGLDRDRGTSFTINFYRVPTHERFDHSKFAYGARFAIIPLLLMTVSDAGFAAFEDLNMWYWADRVGATVAFGLTLPVLIWSVLNIVVDHVRFQWLRSIVRGLTPLAGGLCIGGTIAIIARSHHYRGVFTGLVAFAAIFDAIAGVILIILSIITMTSFRIRIIVPEIKGPSFNSQPEFTTYSGIRTSEDSDDSRDVERGLIADRTYSTTDNNNSRGHLEVRESFDVRGSMDSEQAEGAPLLGAQNIHQAISSGQECEKPAQEDGSVYH